MSSEDLHFQCVDILAKDVFIKDIDSDSDSDSGKKKKIDYDDYKKREEGQPDINDNKKMFTILLFGTDEKGQTICLEIQNFEPFFFIRIPKKFEDEPTKCMDNLKDYLLEFVHEDAQEKLTFNLEKHKTLWDYNLDAYSDFIKISFPSLDLFRRIKDKLLDKKNIPIVFKTNEIFGSTGEKKLGKFVSFEIYESNIDPVLRFFHIQDISPAGWVSVKKGSYLDNDIGDAKTKYSYVADWKDVFPSKESSMAPLLIGSWDIECMSSHGDFPLAKKTWRKIARELIENKITEYESICKQIANGIRLGACGKILPSLTECTYKISPIYLKRGPNDIDANLDETTIDGMIKMSGRREMLLNAFKQDLEKATNDVETQLTAIFPPICGDPVIQIGTVLYRKNTAVSKHIWVLGSCDRDSVKPPGASVPIEVYTFDNEASMIKSWTKWIGKADIDVLIGYNIFGFDEKFLYERCEELGIANLLYPFSRLMSSKVRLEEKFLSSAAMGDNTMYVLKSTGRLQIDMLHYVRRNYNLDSYTLDNVSATFVSGNINGEVELIDDGSGKTFKFKTKSTKGIVVGRYITLMDDENDRVVYKAFVLNVEAKALTILIEGGYEELTETGTKPVKWAQVKDDVSPKELFALHKGDAKDRAKIAKYCLVDCDLVIELFNKLEVLNNSVAMANVCSVPVSFIFTRGQGIKIESLIFKQCMLNDKLIVVLPSPRQKDDVIDDDEGDDPSYEGAIVLDPKTGIYIDDPVTALDFASLYPSTIISENISHDTLIWVKEYDNDMNYVQTVEGSDEYDNIEGASYVNIEFDLLVPDPDSDLKHKPKIKQGIRIARYIQTAVAGRDKIGLEGTIPKILKMLLASRKEARKAAEKEDDEFRKALLDAKQLAYKLTANALYGQLGSGTFKIRRQVLAASTTAYGRKQLMYAKTCIEAVYGFNRDKRCCAEYVYGDTDSVFIKMSPRNPDTGELLHGKEAIEKAKELTEEAGKLISKCLKPPHDFEFDKIFRTFCLLSKKRYVGDMSEGDLSEDGFHRKAMGIVMKRRDNAPIVKYVYGGIVDRILDPTRTDVKSGVLDAFEFVQSTAKDLLDGKFKLNKLTITKSLRAEYADPTRIAHKVLADRIAERDPGNAPSTTERIPFVYIATPPGKPIPKLQGDRIETPKFILDNGLKPDYEFYITNQIAKPVSQVFALALEYLPGIKTELKMTEKARDVVAAREALAEKVLFEKLLTSAKMKTSGQKDISLFFKKM